MGDPTVAGGSITSGDASVLIEGMPVARRGDVVVDPLIGTGMMSSHAITVWAVNMPIARVEDMAAPSVGAAAAGAPEVLGPGTVQGDTGAGAPDGGEAGQAGGADTKDPDSFDKLLGDDTGRTAEEALAEDGAIGPHTSGGLDDIDGDGTLDKADFEASLVEWDLGEDADAFSGDPNIGGNFRGEVLKVDGEVSGFVSDSGVGQNLRGNATYAHGTTGVSVSDGAGSLASVSGDAKLLNADVVAQNVIGANPETGDIGVLSENSIGAAVLEGSFTVGGQTTVPNAIASTPLFGPIYAGANHLLYGPDWRSKVPGADTIIGAEFTGGGSALSVGAGYTGEAVYNPETQTARATVGGKLAALLGIEGKLSIFGMRAPGGGGGTAPAPGPAKVATGASTVEVGQ